MAFHIGFARRHGLWARGGPAIANDSCPKGSVNRRQFAQNVVGCDGRRQPQTRGGWQDTARLARVLEYAWPIKMRNIRDRSGVPLDNFGSVDGGLSVEVSGGAAAAPV